MIEIARLTEANEKALREVIALLPQLRSPASSPHSASMEELKAMTNDANVALFVARDGEKIIGMATLYMIQKLGKRGGYVEDVVVDESYRGQGLGRKLMTTLMAEAKKEGLIQLYLTSRPDRIAAHKLYESLGFQKVETDVFKLSI